MSTKLVPYEFLLDDLILSLKRVKVCRKRSAGTFQQVTISLDLADLDLDAWVQTYNITKSDEFVFPVKTRLSYKIQYDLTENQFLRIEDTLILMGLPKTFDGRNLIGTSS